jgi:hypothetical protein
MVSKGGFLSAFVYKNKKRPLFVGALIEEFYLIDCLRCATLGRLLQQGADQTPHSA